MQIDTEKSYLFYSNLGFDAPSINNILDVAKKVIDKDIKLIINSGWPLTFVCSLDIQNSNIKAIWDLEEIKRWDDKIFMNFTYKELEKYLSKIKYILINYIDTKNIELCALPCFVHEWKTFSALRFMAHSELGKNNKNYVRSTQKFNYIFELFLPLNVHLDTDGILRLRSITNFTQPSYDKNILEINSIKKVQSSKKSNNGNIIKFKYPFERIPTLDTIEMKNLLQKSFTTPTCMSIINLDTTYSISKCLYNILMEELFVQYFFVNSHVITKHPIDSGNSLFITNRDNEKIKGINNEFFYYKDNITCLFDKLHFIEFDFFQRYILLVDTLRDYRKYMFVTAPFEITIEERTSRETFIGMTHFDLNFSKLHSNLDLIL